MKIGLDGVKEVLKWGCNDIGGILMEEYIIIMVGVIGGIFMEVKNL